MKAEEENEYYNFLSDYRLYGTLIFYWLDL